MGIFDGLPNPAAPAQAFQQGMARGRAEREEKEVRGALSAYAINPDDPEAFARLAQWRPEIAIQVRGEQDKRRQAARVAELTQRAAAGDPQAIQELAPIDIDNFLKLDRRQQDHIARGVEYVGQAALAISQLPEAERAAAWDAAAQQGIEQGFAELQDEIGGYSPEALAAALAEAKLTQEAIQLARPDWTPVPDGSALVNTNDPAAVQEYMSGLGAAPSNLPRPQSKAERDALPPGTEDLAPDGTRMRKGGAGASRVGSNFLSGL